MNWTGVIGVILGVGLLAALVYGAAALSGSAEARVQHSGWEQVGDLL